MVSQRRLIFNIRESNLHNKYKKVPHTFASRLNHPDCRIIYNDIKLIATEGRTLSGVISTPLISSLYQYCDIRLNNYYFTKTSFLS